MISKKNKFIFIHIPKTAGVSIEKKFNYHGMRHHTYRWYLKNFPSDYIDKCFKFTIVRNPWDRLVSWYFYNSWRRDLPSCKKIYHPATKKGFSNWILSGCPHHWKKMDGTNWSKEKLDPLTQSDFLLDEYGKIDMDFIGRFEKLQKDFNKICDKLGIKKEKLPYLNRSCHKHYSEYYDEETKQIVAERFKKDIEYFRYKFKRPPFLTRNIKIFKIFIKNNFPKLYSLIKKFKKI